MNTQAFGMPAADAKVSPAAARMAASSADAQRHQVAWQHAMEQAQLTSWFKPTAAAPRAEVIATQPRAAAVHLRHRDTVDGAVDAGRRAPFMAGISASAPVSQAVSVVRPSAGSAPLTLLPMSTAAVRAVSCDGVAAPTGASTPTSVGPLTGARPPVPTISSATSPALAEGSLAGAPGESSPPIRLHAETWPQGQAVWVAMRADDAAMRAALPGIVAELQREFHQHGQRLHQVVCNGRAVWRDGVALPDFQYSIDQLHLREA